MHCIGGAAAATVSEPRLQYHRTLGASMTFQRHNCAQDEAVDMGGDPRELEPRELLDELQASVLSSQRLPN